MLPMAVGMATESQSHREPDDYGRTGAVLCVTSPIVVSNVIACL